MKVVERKVLAYVLTVDVTADAANSTERLLSVRERVDVLAQQFRQAIADRCGVPLRAVTASVTVTRDAQSGRVSYHVQGNASAVAEEQWPELVLPAAAGA